MASWASGTTPGTATSATAAAQYSKKRSAKEAGLEYPEPTKKQKTMPKTRKQGTKRRARRRRYGRRRRYHDALALENKARVLTAIAAARRTNAELYTKNYPAGMSGKAKNPVATRRYRAILKGRGGYWADLWSNARKYVPRAIGGALGIATGTGWGAGVSAGAQFSKNILGWGEYKAEGMDLTGNVPSMHSAGENGVIVTHKEMIGTIYSSTDFHVTKYEINPGVAATFPWLSGLAKNFQQYNIEGLAFVYVPTCSDAVSAGTVASMGSVSMSSDANVMTPEPTSTLGMQAAQFSRSGKPSQHMIMPVEQDEEFGGRPLRHMLIRSGAVPAGQSLQFYDDCVVYVATDGNGVAGVQLGQLYVIYAMTLNNPAPIELGSSIKTTTVRIAASTISTAHPLGTAATAWTHTMDHIGVAYVSPTAFRVARGNAGVYMVNYIMTTDGTGVITPGNVTCQDEAGNNLLATVLVNGTVGSVSGPGAAGAAHVISCTAIVSNPNAVTSWVFAMGPAGHAVAGTVLSGDLIVTQINPGYVHA